MTIDEIQEWPDILRRADLARRRINNMFEDYRRRYVDAWEPGVLSNEWNELPPFSTPPASSGPAIESRTATDDIGPGQGAANSFIGRRGRKRTDR